MREDDEANKGVSGGIQPVLGGCVIEIKTYGI